MATIALSWAQGWKGTWVLWHTHCALCSLPHPPGGSLWCVSWTDRRVYGLNTHCVFTLGVTVRPRDQQFHTPGSCSHISASSRPIFPVFQTGRL